MLRSMRKYQNLNKDEWYQTEVRARGRPGITTVVYDASAQVFHVSTSGSVRQFKWTAGATGYLRQVLGDIVEVRLTMGANRVQLNAAADGVRWRI